MVRLPSNNTDDDVSTYSILNVAAVVFGNGR